jgi:hypothetical protein
MRYSAFAALALLPFANVSFAQTLPVDPVKHLDGYWYGEDRKVEASIKNGVMTVEANTSEDKYVQSLKMPPGTVIGRFTGATIDGKRWARLEGECWTDGSAPQLTKCDIFRANLEVGLEDGKQTDRVKMLTLQFRRKEHMPKSYWEYRK